MSEMMDRMMHMMGGGIILGAILLVLIITAGVFLGMWLYNLSKK